ncbi:enoyl-(Acyl carrier protein) reductase [Hirsutella rhossiliensis]|uniref:Enoyl-(Acyl carrier protein) reductase domain-containing protein n=1 Tax=Hirsutella rhossiliensis TaxID=111463 RepID=A0A9P8SIV3_9HYPO|nr:enoyl-(Acyl carrier protein) reductase domain-containing protein [Hirsutella rhossiliensis]KAH0964276.1 enoyl-(Acyl carrier protein) reductase domain-containing protein [Hirsutella rhossiliensis]
MTHGRLQGKVSIVTGAASGFGKGIAAKFVHEGSKVVIADMADEAGQAAAQELGCKFVTADVSSKSDWERLLSDTLREFGQLDIVVNNAGVTYPNKATEDVTEDEFDLVFKVNVKSMFMSTAVLLPYFLKDNRPGCFIQVASTGGVRPRPRLTWYNATKGALITATKGMAVEYGPKKIRFNAVSPVVGNTGMTHLFLGKPGTAENLAPFVETVPLGRPSEPADVANACCYLASDEASLVTGVNLEVDGGRCV